MTRPDIHPFVLGATTLVTVGGLGVLAVMHQDAPVTTAWRDAFYDGSKFAASFATAVKETVAFGHRIGDTNAAALLA